MEMKEKGQCFIFVLTKDRRNSCRMRMPGKPRAAGRGNQSKQEKEVPGNLHSAGGGHWNLLIYICLHINIFALYFPQYIG